MRLSCVLCALFALGLSPLRAEDVQGIVIPIKTVQVPSPVLQEVIDSILVEEGDEVKEGQPLVQLRNAKEKLSVQEGERIVEATAFTYHGAESLFNQKMGSKDQMLKAQTDWERAKIQLALAQEQLNEKTIRAKLDGIVVKKYKEAGEAVDRGEKLMDIINFDKVYMQVYLDAKLMQVLKPNETVTVRVPVLNDAKFTGTINFIDPRIDAQSGLFRVRVLIDNPNRKIKAGMRVMADFSKKG